MSNAHGKRLKDVTVTTQEMDVTSKEEATTDQKMGGHIQTYLTCGLCDSLYMDPVRPTCCKEAKACRDCAVSHLTDNKKCWNPDCSKETLVGDLVDYTRLRISVEKHKEWEQKFKEGLKIGSVLKCNLCGEICKRGVTLPCCAVAACRACAVKKLTANRNCWVEWCKKNGVTSVDLINDELLRSAIDNYKKVGIVDEDQARQLDWNVKLKKKENRTKKKKKKTNDKKDLTSIHLHISGLPDDTKKQEIKDSFAKFGAIRIGNIGHNKGHLICENADTANGILKERDNIKIGESMVNIEFTGIKCAGKMLCATGMALDTEENDVKDLLGNYGSLKHFKMVKQEKDGEETNCAFFKFETDASVKKIIDAKGLELNGDTVLVSLRDPKPKNIVDKSIPKVAFKGIFLKEDESQLLKVIEQFGVIQGSTFFTKNIEEIPEDVEKFTKKEKNAFLSRVEINFRKQNSATKAILHEKLDFNGHTLHITHVKDTGSQVFKTKLAERQKAILKQKAEIPSVNIKGIFLKKEEDDVISLLEKFGKIEEFKFFTRDLEEIPANAEKLTGKERKKIMSRGVIQFKKVLPAMKAILNGEVIHNGHAIIISHVSGTGTESFQTKLAEKIEAKAQKQKAEKQKDLSTKAQAVKRDSRGKQKNGWDNGWQGGRGATPFYNNIGNGTNGYQANVSLWPSQGYGMPHGPSSLEMRMRTEAMKYMMPSSNYFAQDVSHQRGPNGGGWGSSFSSGGMWGGKKQSRFNQDFTSVTGMQGAKKAKKF